jgi:peptidoglycan/xylan/chitin deacetylase (PgdA/CDA1 family)
MEILASWDDGSIYDMRMAELMKKYSIKTTFFIPAYIFSKPEGNLTKKNCEELSKDFEIGSHSFNHKAMKKMNVAQLMNEIKGSKDFLQNIIGKEIDEFAYPKDSFNALVKGLIKGARYKKARTSIPCWLDTGNDPFAIKCTVQVAIDRIEYKNNSWEKFARSILLKANETSTFHIFGSSKDVEKFNDWENLEVLIKELN